MSDFLIEIAMDNIQQNADAAQKGLQSSLLIPGTSNSRGGFGDHPS